MSASSNWIKSLGLAAGLVVLAASSASAQIIDFQVGDDDSCYSTICDTQGFRFDFVSGGWAISDDGNDYFNRRGLASTGLLGAWGVGNGAPPTVVTMTRVDGGVFSVSSFLGAIGNPDLDVSNDVTLLGSLFAGGTVETTLSFGAFFSGFSVNGFDDLTSLVFSTTNANVGFGLDDINLGPATVVPEPTSVAMLALGLLGVGAAARRRTRTR